MLHFSSLGGYRHFLYAECGLARVERSVMAVLDKSKRLRKELGLLNVFALAAGSTLSTGFFLLPGLAAIEAGPALPLTYLIAAVPLVPGMLCITELSTAMPRAGGAYYFLDRTLGPLVGTIGGLGTWLALTLKAAFALIGVGAYVNLFVPGVPVVSLAVAAAILFGAVNLAGAKGAGRFQLVLVVGLLAILVWLMGGIFHIHPEHFSGVFDRGLDSLFGTAGLVYVSYIGITKVASVSEEVKDPEKNLPRGLFLALGTALIVYVLGTVIMVGIVPMDQLAGHLTPVALTAELLVGRWGMALVTVAALAMSRDHLVPAGFRMLSARGIPTRGVYATVALIVFFLVFFDPTRIAKLASAFQLLMFALICGAVIVMRESGISSYDPGYQSPFYPWLQLFGIFSPFLLIAEMGLVPLLFAAGLLAAGGGWYFYYARERVSRVGAIYHIFERLGRYRYDGLDTELRGILKEKGPRAEDPFDDIVARAVVLDVDQEATFEEISRRVSGFLAERVNADAGHLHEGFLRGTRVGATPVSHGAALPHLRLAGLAVPWLAMVRSKEGLHIDVRDEFGEEFQHADMIQAVFFLLSPEADPGRHLRILAQIAGRVDEDDFMLEWLKAEGEQEMKETLLHHERYLSLSLRSEARTSALVGIALRDFPSPRGCLVALIRRGGETFAPRGDTVLQEGDRLTIIGDPEGIAELHNRFF